LRVATLQKNERSYNEILIKKDEVIAELNDYKK
jgi:hypothetical protein